MVKFVIPSRRRSPVHIEVMTRGDIRTFVSPCLSCFPEGEDLCRTVWIETIPPTCVLAAVKHKCQTDYGNTSTVNSEQ